MSVMNVMSLKRLLGIPLTFNLTDFTQITDVTPGTVTASKAIVVDSNKDITGVRNETITGTLTAGTFATTGINATQTFRCTTQTDATTTTLANITGLTGATVVVGTYKFRYVLKTTCGGTGGTKVAFKLTTTVLSAIDYTTKGFTASAVAVANGTTATDQASQIASNTAAILVEGEGTFTVSTGGTIDLQFAENSANSTSSVLVGSSFELTRIA